MKKEHLAFLLGGLAFGFLFGYGLFYSIDREPTRNGSRTPAAQAAVPAPAGPAAPAATGAAPMMAEIGALKARLDGDPDDLEANVRLANLYHDVQMFAQAIPLYEKAVSLQPSNADLLTDLGTCLQATGRLDEAMVLFDRAQAADPTHWQSLWNTVVVGLRLGQFDRAETALAKLQEVRPDAPHLDELRRAFEEERATRGSEEPS